MRPSAVVVSPLLALLALTALPARADGNVFAVLPTQGTGGVTAEAELAGNMMRIALQEQSLALVPAVAVAAAAAANDTACQQSAVACARLVGKDTGATRVVASELWDQGGTLELRIVVVDVRTGGDPGAWQSFTAKAKDTLGRVAREAVLSLVVPGAFFGRVTVAMTPGAEVLVDGVARERTPMLAPLELSGGRHEIEVRYAKLAPYRGFVDVAMDKPLTLRLCERDGAVVAEGCAEAPSSAASSSSPWVVGGVVALGVGAAGVIVGSIAAGVAASTVAAYANDSATAALRDQAVAAQGLAAGSFVVGGVALIAGAALLIPSMFVE